jgi:hypothetical protein
MSTCDTWFLATGEDVIFRIREGPPTFATKEALPKLLVVKWKFDSEINNGMPLPDILARMQDLENLLEPVFTAARQAFLTVVATGNGVREWQWYAANREKVMELVNKTLGELEPFPVQFSFQHDPGWEAYSQFSRIKTEPPAGTSGSQDSWYPTI